MPQVKPDIETFAQIKVIGVGGSGGSAVDRMVKEGIRGVDFVAMNTDVQALHHNSAPKKIHIGKTVTRGLGAGMDPEMGKRSAEESQNEIREALKDTDMVFITCGLGGGTGSGASPIIAEIARDLGVLTVAVVTKPFSFEGPQRKEIADAAYEDLERNVDTIITIPNDRVLQIIDKKTSLLDAFKIVDDVLRQGVQGISELITVPGLINVDFADVKTIMQDTGSALMGIGLGSADNRAVEAAKSAISSPLLEMSIEGARGILFTITGGNNLGMQEVAEAAKIITNSADDDAKVIFGAVVDESMGEDVRITVIATGFEDRERVIPIKTSLDTEESKSKRPFYSSGIFNRKKEEDENEDEKDLDLEEKKSFSGKRIEDMEKLTTKRDDKKENKDEDDEDLEIPAFIRKKMGL
ncbi:MAG: cell division protein FtsZ [Candidatus Magasanikbacteria bacterium]|nr:cell division protein FtsZ [Candidatus Magasanikbacteria bacterium]